MTSLTYPSQDIEDDDEHNPRNDGQDATAPLDQFQDSEASESEFHDSAYEDSDSEGDNAVPGDVLMVDEGDLEIAGIQPSARKGVGKRRVGREQVEALKRKGGDISRAVVGIRRPASSDPDRCVVLTCCHVS